MRVPLPLTVLAVLALAACGGSSTPTQAPGAATPTPAAIACPATGSGTAARIVDFSFTPNPASVSNGGLVTWTNNDGTAHTVTFDSGPDCGNVASGASLTVQFNAPGTYPYHCSIHSSMKGSVTVTG